MSHLCHKVYLFKYFWSYRLIQLIDCPFNWIKVTLWGGIDCIYNLVPGLSSNCLDGAGRKVDCKEIDTFPDVEFKFGDKSLKLKPADYIRVISKGGDHEDECLSQFYGMDHPDEIWLLGTPLLRQYYSEYNMKSGEESVTFYGLK